MKSTEPSDATSASSRGTPGTPETLVFVGARRTSGVERLLLRLGSMRPSFLLLAPLASVLLSVAACAGHTVSTGDGTPGADGSGTTSGGNGTPSGTIGRGGKKTPGAPFGSNCTYPEIKNPPGCPAAYSRFGGSCDQIGLECWYPGVGDGTSDGCWATALMACQPPRFTDAGDADGGDGGPQTGVWTSSQ